MRAGTVRTRFTPCSWPGTGRLLHSQQEMPALDACAGNTASPTSSVHIENLVLATTAPIDARSKAAVEPSRWYTSQGSHLSACRTSWHTLADVGRAVLHTSLPSVHLPLPTRHLHSRIS